MGKKVIKRQPERIVTFYDKTFMMEKSTVLKETKRKLWDSEQVFTLLI